MCREGSEKGREGGREEDQSPEVPWEKGQDGRAWGAHSWAHLL